MMTRLAAMFIVMCFSANLNAGTVIKTEPMASLPTPVSNNAVALVSTDDQISLLSFLGLNAGKTWQDITRDGAVLSLDSNEPAWRLLPVPVSQGRLAAVAATAGGRVYLFGGYTVAEDGSEVSTPEVFRLSEDLTDYELMAPMPVPVDDAVAVVYQDRFIYLISGWHDLGNVNLVQVLDTQNNQWQQVTQWPGESVFGHAGGMVGKQMVICDGVKVVYSATIGESRQFVPSSECWLGRIDDEDHRRIHWHPLANHPGAARYRMAAASDEDNRVVFVGGSENPYNFDGIGYNGEPSGPLSGVFSYNLKQQRWECHGHLDVATMDHRGLPYDGEWFYVVGGMRAGQQVSDQVIRFALPPGMSCD